MKEPLLRALAVGLLGVSAAAACAESTTSPSESEDGLHDDGPNGLPETGPPRHAPPNNDADVIDTGAADTGAADANDKDASIDAPADVTLDAAVDGATNLDGLLFQPPTGTDLTPIWVTTQRLCTGGDSILGWLSGPGFATRVVAVGNSDQAIYLAPGSPGYRIPLRLTMRDFAGDNGGTPLNGRYVIEIECIDGFPMTVFDSFSGSIWFTTPTTYQSTSP